MLHALTREVSRAIADCQLTHLERESIDLDRTRAEHRAYVRTLKGLGVRVIELPEEPELPDSVFVEDTVIVVGGVAVVLRPGALSRRAETPGVARALAVHLEVRHLDGEGTVDGGDVLRFGTTLFVGLSTRSDPAGIAALGRAVAPLGFAVRGVALGGCLHLKSAVTVIGEVGGVGESTLLVNDDWVDPAVFAASAIVKIDPAEPYAANALRVGESLVYPRAFPATAERLRAHGFELALIEVSELAKAEGAVTCCSVLFESPRRQASGAATPVR